MSVLCTLIEISNHILDLVQINREVMYLYFNGLYDREALTISNSNQLSEKEKEVIGEVYKLYPEFCDCIKQNWNISDCKSVLDFKKYHFDCYLLIKEYIPNIIEWRKNCDFLSLGRDWHLVSFLFSGNVNPNRSKLVMWNQSCLGINTIHYRKNVLEFGEKYYLTINEVKELSELMQEFTDEIIAENLQQLKQHRKSIYQIEYYKHSIWQDKSSFFLYAKELCDMVRDFYCGVASRGNCIIIDIG